MEKQAKRIAYSIIMDRVNRPTAKVMQVDRRTKVGKLALEMVCEIEKTFDFEKAYRKRKERREKKVKPFLNILGRPIVKDYLNNKHQIKAIHKDRIDFFGRNHWAKDATDFKIIEILMKTHLIKTDGSHFRRVIRGENMMTPNLIGFYKIKDGEVEISQGTGIWGDELYGVTVVIGGKQSYELNALEKSLADAEEYVKSLM